MICLGWRRQRQERREFSEILPGGRKPENLKIWDPGAVAGFQFFTMPLGEVPVAPGWCRGSGSGGSRG